MTTPQRLGVGLISVGWMGKVHTRAYQALPVFYPELGIVPELVIAADPVPDRQDYARDVLGFAEATNDYHEVLARADVDVVSICAPNFLHAEIGIAAAKAGKSFWIDLAPSIVGELIEMGRNFGRQSQSTKFQPRLI